MIQVTVRFSGGGRKVVKAMSSMSAVAFLFAQAGALHAQTAAAEEAATTDNAEIVVTATRRNERLIDVPQAVTVLSADGLAQTGATQFRDFADSVPGLSFQTSGAGFSQITLRGVTAGADVGATVSQYVDDVPYGSSTSFSRGGQFTLDSGLFDIDRIEVLRGPQGTLYGASSMGGLIKYVTNKPDLNAFSGRVRAGLSTTHHGGESYELAGMVNAPISEGKAALRVSGFYQRDGGYIDNLLLGQKDVNDSDIYGVRAELRLQPSERLEIRIGGFLQNLERGAASVADFRLSGVPVDDSLSLRRIFPEYFDQRFRLGSLTINYDLGFASLTSITSYQETRSDYFLDNTINFLGAARTVNPNVAASAALNTVGTDKFTQEVRISSEEGKFLTWQVGGFYTNEDSTFTEDLSLRDAAGASLANNVYRNSSPSSYREYSGFGNLTLNFSERFDITGGLRYSHSSTSFEQIGFGPLIATLPRTTTSDNTFTYLANARYHFSGNSTAYLRYATGFRPGGPNFVLLNPTTGVPVGPTRFEADELTSYEVGYKGSFLNGRFGIELAAYYIDWSNVQLLTSIATTTNGSVSFKTNAPGGAEVTGLEAAFSARPVRGLSLTGSLTYQDAKLSEADPILRAAKGERLPTVPRYTANFAVDYTLPESDLEPTIGATIRYVDDRTASYNNAPASRPQYRLPDYTVVDLRAGVKLGRIQAQAYVRNLFDVRGQLLPRVNPTRAGQPLGLAILQPRTIGLSLTADF